jgi:hypothetical protein
VERQNLFYLCLPRLSVDIDLNYIGSTDVKTMQEERREIDHIIQQIAQEKNFTISRNPTSHSGGKYIFRYQSALGHTGNLELDINYMHRLMFLSSQEKESVDIAGFKTKFLVQSYEEVVAGKLCALFSRSASRDLFDTYQIVKQSNFDFNNLRNLFLAYAAMDKKCDWRKIGLNNIHVEQIELKNKLIPMLSITKANTLKTQKNLATEYIDACREALKGIFQLKENEIEFYNQLYDHGSIRPDFISTNKTFCNVVTSHPGIIFSARKAIS